MVRRARRALEGDRADARAYADTGRVALVTSWREAEDFLKSAEAALDWWDREEAERKALLARAEAQYPERALWTSLTELTTEAGDLVHGKAAMAAARMGGAAPASIHVAAGAAAQAVYQLAVARVAGEATSLFEASPRTVPLVRIFNQLETTTREHHTRGTQGGHICVSFATVAAPS